MEMWNNPTCSKCAAAREAFELAGTPVWIRAYLDTPPTADELTEVLARLSAQPWDICRLGEPVAGSLGMEGWERTEQTRARWVAAMVAHPQLIQRPIVLLDDGSAVVARDPQTVARVVERAAS